VKQGFQVNDHAGWVKLDGRAVVTLTVTQQAEAALLGFTTNIPDATGTVLMQNGGVMGAVSGNMAKTIALVNLPAVNLTAASGGAHTHVTDSQGAHSEHVPFASVYGSESATTKSAFNSNAGTETLGAHTHTALSAGAHTHTVALGGSGTALDCTPRSMSVNIFLYLGV
jgi:hypothetical protein